jgi:flagella basal body P-ring formation protein FlgA
MILAALFIAASQQSLSPQALRPLVLRAAAAIDAHAEVSDVLGLVAVHVARGEVTVEVTPLAAMQSGRVPARVRIHSGGDTREVSAVLVVSVYREAWCVSHAMAAQAVLEEKDLVRKRVRDDAGLADAPIGTRLVRAKAAGEMVRRWDIAKVPIVRQRAHLTMWARSGGVQASVPVEAREAGAEGDTIHVFNLAANKMVLARVMSASEVEVVQ